MSNKELNLFHNAKVIYCIVKLSITAILISIVGIYEFLNQNPPRNYILFSIVLLLIGFAFYELRNLPIILKQNKDKLSSSHSNTFTNLAITSILTIKTYYTLNLRDGMTNLVLTVKKYYTLNLRDGITNLALTVKKYLSDFKNLIFVKEKDFVGALVILIIIATILMIMGRVLNEKPYKIEEQ